MSSSAMQLPDGQIWFECILAVDGKSAGLTGRKAVPCLVTGRALCGPTTFPSFKPETSKRERAALAKSGRWMIVTR